MWTAGFTCGYSDNVVNDVPFQAKDGENNVLFDAVSTYITAQTSGDLVYMDSAGYIQWAPGIFTGYNPIAAKMILTSAIVNGVPRSTTATGLAWFGATLR